MSDLNGRLAKLEAAANPPEKHGWWINNTALVMVQIYAEREGLDISNQDWHAITGLRLPAPVLSWSPEGYSEVARYLLRWLAGLDWERSAGWDEKQRHIAFYLVADPAELLTHCTPDEKRAILLEAGWLEGDEESYLSQ